MAVRYLLDTNTASYVIRGNFPRVRERLLEIPISDVGVSAVTEAELRFGAERLPESARVRALVKEFLATIAAVPWDSDAAVQYARLRFAAERAGTPIGNLDLMIASHALAVGAVLVSHDRVFRRVRELKTEDWT